MAKKSGDKEAIAALEAKVKQPELQFGMALYVNAFIDLDTERDWLNPIPWSSIIHYCDFYGLSHSQTEDMVVYIRAADNEVLRNRAAEQQQNAARNRE